jgi:hypothetical protein
LRIFSIEEEDDSEQNQKPKPLIIEIFKHLGENLKEFFGGTKHKQK